MLLASLVVAVLDWVIGYLSVYVYAVSVGFLTRRSVSDAEIGAFSDAMVYGGPLLHLVLTLLAARWVSLRSGERFVVYGAYVGLVSTVLNQVIGLNVAPFRLDQAARYLVPALLGGWLGGLWGRATWRRREALYNTSLQINSAENAGGIVAAIGENLAGSKVSDVSLWGTDSGGGAGDPQKLVTLASWATERDHRLSPEALLGGGKRTSELLEAKHSPVFLRAGELPEEWSEARRSRNIGSALLLPLQNSGVSRSAGAARAGVLAIAFRRSLWRPARNVVRDYQTMAAQVMLALENMRLLEEAQRTGREAGVLVERQRLAREIHDTLAQGFNSIVIKLETLEKRLPLGAGDARRDLDLARSTARDSLAEARRLIWALRPEALDRHSLPEALQTLAERWSEENGVSAGVNVIGAPRQLPTEIETALLRTAQETLSNARKHARAGRVMLTLSYMKDLVVLDARDDGVGFDPGEVSGEVRPHGTGGFGLRAMRERISQLGGSVALESELGEGTSLAVELPVTSGGEHEHTGEPGSELEPAEGIAGELR